MTTVIWLGPVLSILLIILVIFLILFMGARLLWFAINGIVGLVILYLLDFFPGINVPINVWSFLITAFGGFIGIVILVLLSLVGIVIA